MSIEDQIAQAEAAAANTPATQPVEQNTSLAPAPAAAAPVDMSIGAVLNSGSLQPDIWLDVKDTGFKLNKQEKSTVESFKAKIDFSQVKTFMGLRVKLPGNKFEYIKTYDGKTESRSGKPWSVALQEANARASEPAEQYRGADVLMILNEDTKQGNATIEAGKKVGYTTSVTAFGVFQTFLAEMIKSGDVKVIEDNPFKGEGEVDVIVTHIEKSNANYTWGVAGFEKA